MSTLLFITSLYPNQVGDTAFIEKEIEYTAQKFNKILVLSHGNPDKPCVGVPKNVEVRYFKKNRLISKISVFFLMVLSSEFWKELYVIFKDKKGIACIKDAAFFLAVALLESKQILSISRVEKKIGIFYTFWYNHSTFACEIAAKKRKLHAPVCTRAHGGDIYEIQTPNRYQPYKAQMDRLIKKVFFVSQNGIDYYKNKFATQNDNTYELYRLGTDNSREFKPQEYTDTIQLLSVSYIIPVKRIHLIIEALSKCARNNMKINWVHIGDGPELDKLRSLAESCFSKYDSITFSFLGRKTNEEVLAYYENNVIDLFVNTSESEGIPVSVMEAMSYGIPAAASNVGGMAEIIDETSGWLLSPDNCPDELSNILIEWKGMSQNERIQKAGHAYSRWKNLFNAKTNYKMFSEKLSTLV